MFRAKVFSTVLAIIALALLVACGGETTSPATSTATSTVESTATQMPAQPSATATVEEPTPTEPSPTIESAPVAPTATPAAQTFENYAKPDVLVDTQWILAHKDDPAVQLVDVSPNIATYQAGHLPGAIYIEPFNELSNPENPVQGEILTQEALSRLLSERGIKPDDTVVLYDDSKNLWAARAYWVLKYYRHRDVRVYNGGSQKWLADGQELTGETVEIQPSTYEAGPADPAIRTTWEDVVSSVDDPGTLFCDARSIEEYTGERVNAERGGRVPGAVNIEWSQAVGQDGTFLSAPELYALYSGAGFTPDRKIVTYCQTGIRAAHTWFVLHELLGYPNVRTYDGSWTEYGNRDDSPIEK